ncbi:MAG: Panacea domain-containing protein [Rhodospirillales bacterium]
MSIQFKFNPLKALEAVLWLANQKPGITLHTVSKVLFFADRRHLNAYGRPVLGDKYAAMDYGPVPSATYEILKGDPIAVEALGGGPLPFEVRGNFHVHAARAAETALLSESDVECLAASLAENGDLSFSQLVEKSHNDPAYRPAEEHWMDYANFLDADELRAERIEDLNGCARRMVM